MKYLTSGRFNEPTQIYLGVGKTARRGRGIGPEQEKQIIDALTHSKIIKKGLIETIQELELHIEGIGPDKISDLVSNIILSCLAQYTEEVCKKYGISTQPCAVSGFWNQDRNQWDGGYYNLPVNESDSISYILVPKVFVRREKDLLNHTEFYNKYILNVIKRELLNANDSLVETLANGERRITKKAISDDPRFELSKEFISEFIVGHPDLIREYRNNLATRYNPADPAFWSQKYIKDDPGVEQLLEELKTLSPGKKAAARYQELIYELLKFIFDWALSDFDYEYKMDHGRSRIDIISNNHAYGGLFQELKTEFTASSLPIECKNYKSDLGNDEFNQLSERLGEKSSKLGMLFCRKIEDPTSMSKHQTDRWLRQGNMLLLFEDSDLGQLVAKRLNRDIEGIESVLRTMIRDVKFGH